MTVPARRSAGFSLVELLIVIVLVSILATLALPNFNPTVHDQLVSTSEIVAGDLAYARNLAVSNNSKYTLTFDVANSRYTLTHTGANSALNTLPKTPFRSSSDTATKQIVDLRTLPHIGAAVTLYDVQAVGSSSNTRITTIEFGPLGQTTQVNPSLIWLASGSGTARRYVAINVNPITGLATPGVFQGAAPAIPGSGS